MSSVSMNIAANPFFRCLVRIVIITHRSNTELTCKFLINVVNPYLQWNYASRRKPVIELQFDQTKRPGQHINSFMCTVLGKQLMPSCLNGKEGISCLPKTVHMNEFM